MQNSPLEPGRSGAVVGENFATLSCIGALRLGSALEPFLHGSWATDSSPFCSLILFANRISAFFVWTCRFRAVRDCFCRSERAVFQRAALVADRPPS